MSSSPDGQEFPFTHLEGDIARESHMLTGDLNVAVVEWSVAYSIRDPVEYLFGLRNVETTFRNLNEAVMSAAVGDRSIDEVIALGRLEIENEVKARLQELCDRLGTGLVVEQIVLLDVNPPKEVKPSFDEVNTATRDRACSARAGGPRGCLGQHRGPRYRDRRFPIQAHQFQRARPSQGVREDDHGEPPAGRADPGRRRGGGQEDQDVRKHEMNE